ncbi:MAG: DNA-3-methyladenine glycosylase [Salinispira sp.]
MEIISENHRLHLTELLSGEYPGTAVECARFFLGCILLNPACADNSPPLAGIIIETEAYTASDPASHSSRGKTPGNQAMFSRSGTLYVYRSYGIHHCANIVTEPGNAVLIRALLPLSGIAEMRRIRGGKPDTELCRGPGNVCAAMRIDMENNFTLLNSSTQNINTAGTNTETAGQNHNAHLSAHLKLFTCTSEKSLTECAEGKFPGKAVIKSSPRIGISKNTEAPLRFFIDIPDYVSRSRRGRVIG